MTQKEGFLGPSCYPLNYLKTISTTQFSAERYEKSQVSITTEKTSRVIATKSRSKNMDVHEQARQAFETHEISDRGEKRWTLSAKEGFTHSVEIIVGKAGTILVHGDYGTHVFAYGPDDNPLQTLKWMGRSQFGSYIVEKAQIGSGHNDLVYVDDIDKFEYDIDELFENMGDWGLAPTELSDLKEEFERAKRYASNGELHEARNVVARAGFDLWESAGSLGRKIAPRLYYAHAAIRRLCDLLDEEEEMKWHEKAMRKLSKWRGRLSSTCQSASLSTKKELRSLLTNLTEASTSSSSELTDGVLGRIQSLRRSLRASGRGAGSRK